MNDGYRPLDDDAPRGRRPGARDKKDSAKVKSAALNSGRPFVEADGLMNLAQIAQSGFIPVREWLVQDVIPMANVTQLSGDGGLGKSLLTLQLAVCCAMGLDWLGMKTRGCRTLAVFCEDDADEITRRLYEVTAAYGYRIEDLVEHVDIVTRVGEENALLVFDRFGEQLPTFTPLYCNIHAQMTRNDYGLVILDSSHDLFIGNENDRTQVRRFVSSLRALALINNSAVVLNSHPSVTGMNSGSGSSGSTGWNNAVRSRLYLTRPEGATDKRYRVLKTMKANYALGDTDLALEWENGIMVPSATVGTADKAMRALQSGQALPLMIEKVQALCDRAIYPSPFENHPREYIVKLLLKEPEFNGFEKGGMTALVTRAVAQKMLETILIPKTRRGGFRQVLVPMGFRPPKQAKIDFDNQALAERFPTAEEIEAARLEMETPAEAGEPPPADDTPPWDDDAGDA